MNLHRGSQRLHSSLQQHLIAFDVLYSEDRHICLLAMLDYSGKCYNKFLTISIYKAGSCLAPYFLSHPECFREHSLSGFTIFCKLYSCVGTNSTINLKQLAAYCSNTQQSLAIPNSQQPGESSFTLQAMGKWE